MVDAYRFIGYDTLIYLEYADLDNGDVTLVADPGKKYHIRACDTGLAVPPPDGRWEIVRPPVSPPKRRS